MKSCVLVTALLFAASGAIAQEAALTLGLIPPVDVVEFGKYADGGSMGGLLRDSVGAECEVILKHSIFQWSVRWDAVSGREELLAKEDTRGDAIVAILIDWVDRNFSKEEQASLRQRPRYHPAAQPAASKPAPPQILEQVANATAKTDSLSPCERNGQLEAEIYVPYSQSNTDKAWQILVVLDHGAWKR